MVRLGWRGKALLLIMTLVFAGCSRAGAPTREESRDRQGALSAVTGYMEGRKANDLPAAFEHLSKATRELYSQDEFVAHYAQFRSMEWKQVGPVKLVDKDWARIVVYDISVTDKNGARQQLPDFPYYVQKQDDRWGVALVNPLFERLESISDVQKEIEYAAALLKVNPYSSTVHAQLYYVHVSQGDAAKAEEQLRTLYKVSGPSDLANLQAMRAHFYLNTRRSPQAVSSLTSALKLSEAYPERYTDRWRSSVLTTQARAHLTAGENSLAREVLDRALVLDPKNADARQLLEGLKRPQT